MKLYSAPLRSRLQIRAPYLEAAGTEATLKETNAWKYRPSVITDDDGIVLESNGLDREATRPQRIYGWHVDGWIAEGSCRLVLEGPSVPSHLFGSKSVLGNEPADPKEFCVFPSISKLAFDSARDTAFEIMRDVPQVTAFEIHQYRNGQWYNIGAGVARGSHS